MPPDQEDVVIKKPYKSPKLERFGTVTELTHLINAGNSQNLDNGIDQTYRTG